MERKKVLLTGASSGIGKATAIKLVSEGYKVYGIGRSMEGLCLKEVLSENTIDNFVPIVFDLTNTGEIPALIKELEKDGSFNILINNAGVGYYGTHETLTPAQIHEIAAVNFEVPLLLSNLLLKNLKTNGGCIVNISSVTADRINTHGCAYGAAKAGLASFGRSLFEETRKHGVKVINIYPDMTDTALYRNADFTVSAEKEARLEAEDIADAVCRVLKAPERMTVTDITIRPQKHRISKK